ncbi:MAG TPA: iron transporter FeoB [Peptococcaceae bacterium]|nr:iron transporter FeoB [Peptococcaceae bacterium]
MSIASHGRILKDYFGIVPKQDQIVIALAGNPNVGKSTVFNALTGLKQHTGNWPGKTVDNAQGSFTHRNNSFLLVDLPGTYSLLAHTVEEEVARDFICFGHPDVTVVVLDATSLERNLNLALQIMEITAKVVVGVNLIDEAEKKKITIDFPGLEKELGVPVVPMAARLDIGLKELKEKIFLVASGKIKPKPLQISYSEEVENAVQSLLPYIEQLGISKLLNPRWVALRLLDGDEKFIAKITSHLKYQNYPTILREAEVAI